MLTIPTQLLANCGRTPEGAAWLERLRFTLRELERRWSISSAANCEDVSCAWVARVRRADGTPVVLKLGMPHMEGEHESLGLRFWDGNPTVRLLDADEDLGAMLLECCEPGTALSALPEPEQDVVIARLLNRLWRLPPPPHPFRPLAAMTASWSRETLRHVDRWRDLGLVMEGLRLFEELPRTASREVLLATDLHAGNVLRAQREPWLVIDPKPFVGDPAYDATQHLFNCMERLRSDPRATIRRFADLLSVDHERVRWWTFARAAAEPRDVWAGDDFAELARAIAP
ncbi:MAG TPA: aminoglycoside phosphotransferase family protein [Terriglobia bacterium]|nr:aminoglycoside phosphotransferase family protein [Terriglobia bacterium]